MGKKTAFVAYPGSPQELSFTINTAVKSANATSRNIDFHTWEHNDIAGRPLTLPILTGIENAEVVVADVTKLNFNVCYEVGYAIGIQKRVILVKNSSLLSDDTVATKVGIFDTLGYETYPDQNGLCAILIKSNDHTPLKFETEIDNRAPVYLLETPIRTPSTARIVTRVKKARLFYRSFTPSEDARLSAIDAIRHVSKSVGVLIPLLSPEYQDAFVHNIRAAFIAGLAHGMGKRTLVLQDGRHNVPLDLRDAAETYFSLDEINNRIQEFAGDVYEILQMRETVNVQPGSILQQISLGDPMAENEFQTLASYYVQTDEYNRALRGEINLVVGRKGTGKTALFFQVRDHVRKDKRNVVIDLKPEGYQLVKLKEHVLDLLSDGAKGHLITAFWEYLLLLEIARKVLENDKERKRFDNELSLRYENLKKLQGIGLGAVEGDFSERLLILSQNIIDAYEAKFGGANGVRLTTDQVTNLLHTTTISELRAVLEDYLIHKSRVLVLFDNLDRGWSYKGIGSGDILILRCLIDAARKVQREMRKAEVTMSCIVFVRNDIYQLLMDSSPDFGKETRASLDWSDSDLLREVLRRRLIQIFSDDLTFTQVWGSICTSHYSGEETSQYLIDRSLMRPRNLLKLVGYCKGFAVNLDHEKIESDDILKGLNSYSSDLLIEADRELSDVIPEAADLLYEFVGEPSELSEDQLYDIIKLHGVNESDVQTVVDCLLYFGFLGIRIRDEDPRYIYNFNYDLKILIALRRKNSKQLLFILNPAFWLALGVETTA